MDFSYISDVVSDHLMWFTCIRMPAGGRLAALALLCPGGLDNHLGEGDVPIDGAFLGFDGPGRPTVQPHRPNLMRVLGADANVADYLAIEPRQLSSIQ
jgi:hypothetical protein